MYAIMKACGKQYKVQEGDIVFLEKLGLEQGEKVNFEEVIAVSNENGLTIGAPLVEGAVVSGVVLKNGKSPKIMVFKYKSKKNYRKRQGHRQLYTKVQIESIKA